MIRKRRYLAFYGTDFEILLKGLGVDTLIMVGGLTDVCVQFTFLDGHQGDYFCRVIEECVVESSVEAHGAVLRAMEYLQIGPVRVLADVLSAMRVGWLVVRKWEALPLVAVRWAASPRSFRPR